MKYIIRGKKVKVTNDLKEHTEKKLSKLDKYFNENEEFTATVLIRAVEPNYKVEVTIPVKKIILRAEESHKDPFAAIDLIVDKLERQIRKNKTRMSKKVIKDNTIIVINLRFIKLSYHHYIQYYQYDFLYLLKKHK